MSGVSFDAAMDAARDHYASESLAHAERVAQTAADIATAYGHDPDLARVAGLLHDWARDMPEDQLMDAAAAAGVDVTDLDREVPYLLHARVGADLLREALPGVPEEVVRSVEVHTVGSGMMSWLDMVVYAADMIEPSRAFPAAPGLRDAVGAVSLPELFRRCYVRSMEHLVETRRHIHPDSVQAWNSQVAGRWDD